MNEVTLFTSILIKHALLAYNKSDGHSNATIHNLFT